MAKIKRKTMKLKEKKKKNIKKYENIMAKKKIVHIAQSARGSTRIPIYVFKEF